MHSVASHSRHVAKTKPQPVPSKPVLLDASMTVRTALQKALRASFQHILANRKCEHRDICPEAVHQLRVGSSRIRGLLSVFHKVVENEERDALIDELRWFRQQLGPAREWDVSIDEIIAPLSKGRQSSRKMGQLKSLANAHRTSAHQNVREVLHSPLFKALLHRLKLWIDLLSMEEMPCRPDTANFSSEWKKNQKRLAKPVMYPARKALHAQHMKVRKLGRRIQKHSETELHKLRIQVKELRYTMELFNGLLDTEAADRYLARLKELQSVLGSIHDTTVAGNLIHSICLESGTPVEQTFGETLERIAARHKNQRKQLHKLWKRFTATEASWNK